MNNNINEFQSKLLEILTWAKDFLEKNNITYYMIGGTMLGAVRHQGFIPWDDDADIIVPRPDYERLLKLFKEQKDGYVLESQNDENKDYVYFYAKLYDTKTTLVEHARKDIKRGVFLDIFPLDGIGDAQKEELKHFKKIKRNINLLEMKAAAYRKDRKWWKNCSLLVGRLLPISTKRLTRKIDKLCQKYDYDESKYVALLGSSLGKKEIMPKEVYGKPTLYKFENIELYGPEKFDEFLTRCYGDWRQLPPVEKRKTAHTFAGYDLNKSYLED